MSYPKVKIVGIRKTKNAPDFETSVLDVSDEVALAEVMDFYETLIPQLACAIDGSHNPTPSSSWILATDRERKVILVKADGQLHGVWVVREGQILYPCANNKFLALIYSLLWTETIKHYDHVYAHSENPYILQLIVEATKPLSEADAPVLTGKDLEWNR